MKKLSLLLIVFVCLTSFASKHQATVQTKTDKIRFIKAIGGPQDRPILRNISLTVEGFYDSEDKTIEMIYYTEIGSATMYVDGFPYELSGTVGTSETVYLLEALESSTITIVCRSGDEYQGYLN